MINSKLGIDHPRFSGRFLNVSITGDACALHCDHCQGTMLKGMIPAPTPQKLKELGLKLREKGATGLLITGGCNPEGMVPLKPFLYMLYPVDGILCLLARVYRKSSYLRTRRV